MSSISTKVSSGANPALTLSLIQGVSLLLAGGLLLTGIGGAFAPWVWRESVALQLTAPGLAEFVKFLPEVRLGQLHIERLYFLSPLFLAMLALPLLISHRELALPAWLRVAGRLAVLPLALAALPPVWTPAILVAPEFRLQTALAIGAVGMALLLPPWRGVPLKILGIALGVGGIIVIILSSWQFSLIQNALGEVYRSPVSLGWGWWLTAAGVGLSIIGGVGTIFWRDDQERADDKKSRGGIL